MTIRKIREILNAGLLTDGSRLDDEILTAYGSDMMSDVLAFAGGDRSVLLTGLVTPQTVRTAQMTEIRCIVFVRGRKPESDIVRLAQGYGIELLSTGLRMFAACGLLYENGLREEP